jgi:serine/threonine protein kinase
MKVKNYLLTEEIGSGSFSTVYKAIDVADHNKVYAIKSMREIPQNVTDYIIIYRKKKQ